MSEHFDFDRAMSDVLPPMHAAVLETTARLHKEQPGGVEITRLGVKAWESLTLAQQQEALPIVLGAYVGIVHDEENHRRKDEAARDTTHSYLDDVDVQALWDEALAPPDEDGAVSVGRQELINVLCELELLQHRLSMREGGES